MKKILLIFTKVVLYGIVVLTILLGAITVALQTEWGRSKFRSALTTAIAGADFQLHYKKLGGILPFYWEITGLEVTLANGDEIAIDTLRFRPYLLRLLQRKLSFRSFYARDVVYKSHESFTNEFLNQEVALPLSLYVKSYQIENITLPLHGEMMTFDLKGKIKLDRRGSAIYLNSRITRKGFAKSKLHLRMRSEKNRLVKVTANIRSERAAFLEPFFTPPLDFAADMHLRLFGNFSAFQNLVFNPGSPDVENIKGHLYGNITKINESMNPLTDFLFEEDWYLSSKIDLYSDRSMRMQNIDLLNRLFEFRGQANFFAGFSLDKFQLNLKTHDLLHMQPLTKVPISGHIDGQILGRKEAEKTKIDIDYVIESLRIDDYYLKEFVGHVTGFYDDQIFTGTSELSALFYNQFWEGKTAIHWEGGRGLHLEELSLSSFYSELSGDFLISPELLLLGSANMRVDDLSLFEVFYEGASFYGGLEGIAAFNTDGKEQKLDVHFDIYDFFYKDIHIDYGICDVFFRDVTKDPTGEFHTELSNLYLRGIQCQDVAFTTSTEQETWPFSLSVFGEWRDPFEVYAQGFWKMKGGDFLLDLQNLYGHLFRHPFDLVKPSAFSWEKESISLSDFDLSLLASSLTADVKLAKNASEVVIEMDHFPVDFLSLNPLELSVEGYASGSLSLAGSYANATGDLSLDIESLEVLSIADETPFTATGTFQAKFRETQTDFDGKLFVREDERITAEGELPMTVFLMPQKVSWNYDAPVQGKFFYDARAEDFLDFINIGPHRFEADVLSDLSFAGSLSDLSIDGSIDFWGGSYENYYTGSHFQNISGKAVARGNRLHLDEFHGEDEDTGVFCAKGYFDIDPRNNFPFSTEVSFDDLVVVDIPLVIANATGTVDVKGDLAAAKATGSIEVTNADFTIPEKIPPSIPSLQVQYINEPEYKTEERIFPGLKKTYPLYFDIGVQADDNIYIYGRGLNSEWRGDFRIGGTYDDILAKGALRLMRGDFAFAGRFFDLISGSLTFTGKSRAIPYLEISGKTEQSGTSIIASLKGALNAPHLTFRSFPAQPLSAILSLLIFGEDISEITVFQAATLAAAAASLSGQGPDIFEITRRTLGVDRFAVVNTPAPTQDKPDVPSLQIGKYLMRGLLVSVSHGADKASGNVSIEVDLTRGFIFQAETIQQQAQGKFTLKWHYNY